MIPLQTTTSYYRTSEYDAQQADILARYKDYNSHEGNSPSDLDNTESYPTSGTSLPDIEDINRDNTLNEGESLFCIPGRSGQKLP